VSKYQEYRCELKDRETILAAAEAAGLKCDVAASGKTLVMEGWFGVDNQQRAEIVFRRATTGLRTDIGLKRDGDGWAWAGDHLVIEDKRQNTPRGVIGAIAMWSSALTAKALVESQGNHMALSLDPATGLVLGTYTAQVTL